MNAKKYSGIFPALFTPFKENGTINEKATETLIEMNLRRGVDGFYIGGSSGEAFLMSAEERMLALRLCADIVGGRVTMIAQVGDASEDKALRLAAYARLCGYDSVSAVTPFYYKFSFNNIKDYYRNIAAAAELPLLVYYIPRAVRRKFHAESGAGAGFARLCGWYQVHLPRSVYIRAAQIRLPGKDDAVRCGRDAYGRAGARSGRRDRHDL